MIPMFSCDRRKMRTLNIVSTQTRGGPPEALLWSGSYGLCAKVNQFFKNLGAAAPPRETTRLRPCGVLLLAWEPWPETFIFLLLYLILKFLVLFDSGPVILSSPYYPFSYITVRFLICGDLITINCDPSTYWDDRRVMAFWVSRVVIAGSMGFL